MKLYGIVKSDRKLPLQEVTNIFNENRPRPLSDRTVQRNLYETKYHSVKKGLAWCKLNGHKTVNDFWKKVIYSEECKVELGMDNCVLTWRRPDKNGLHLN